ncbi:MAG: beta-galactosidase, partial [Victivallales bacterium]|nr:beta-galactosidase [Victivallales bacterium]
MKTHRFTLLISALLVAASSLLSAATMNKDFDDHGKALINPMMGWFHEFYSDMAGMRFPVADCEQLLNDFPGVSTVYMRFPWGALEPEEGKYNWSVIDWVAQQWIARGRKIARRFITSATGEYRYATPKWVLDAGAKHIFITNKPGGLETAEVHQDDPIFLEKLENFLKAAAERYDGNPHVAFIDVAFGTWGEGHTVITHKLSQEENMRQAEIHANMYRRLFPNTLLVISDDVVGPFEPGNDWPLMQRLRKMGITLRDDSILILPSAPSWHGALAQHYWPTMPVIIEHQILDISIRAKAWDSKKLL